MEDLETESMDWMNEYGGQGQEALSDARSIPFLTLIQPGSQHEGEDTPAGTWCNSATGECYGVIIKVVPLAFHVVWAEREPDGTRRTVARYKPNSIEVEVRQSKGSAYGKMYSKESGNEIQEQYMYAVILPEHLEAGVLLFNPTLMSMKTCRSWNSAIFGQLLPNGVQAPLFAYAWQLVGELVPNPQQPNKQCAKFVKAIKSEIVAQDLFATRIKPQLSIVQNSMIAIEQGSPEGEE